MSALEELRKLPGRGANPYIADWKERGGKVVGYVCSYVPEEIISAAGLLPYRIEARGVEETDLADIYMHRFNCTYARSILQAGLSGQYHFLDGFCFLNGCEQIRRIYENWEKHVGTPHMYMVTVPHSLSDAGFEWYRDEIANFREKLRSDFGMPCSDADLRETFHLYNQSKRLLAQLYALRREASVPISGADAARLVLSAYTMPRSTYNTLLAETLAELRERPGKTDYRARLIIGGSALDDPKLIEIVEGLGGIVVGDTHCYGSRYCTGEVDEQVEPLDALANAYYYRSPCPRMLGQYKTRLQYTEETARAVNADGVILQRLVFCDHHGVDSPMLAEDLEAKGIPVLVLEREHVLSDVGRLRTRVEAFLERIDRR